MVYICTKIARQMDTNGLDKVFDAAETATAAIEEARPLLENAVKLVDEVRCCLQDRQACHAALPEKVWQTVLGSCPCWSKPSAQERRVNCRGL